MFGPVGNFTNQNMRINKGLFLKGIGIVISTYSSGKERVCVVQKVYVYF